MVIHPITRKNMVPFDKRHGGWHLSATQTCHLQRLPESQSAQTEASRWFPYFLGFTVCNFDLMFFFEVYVCSYYDSSTVFWFISFLSAFWFCVCWCLLLRERVRNYCLGLEQFFLSAAAKLSGLGGCHSSWSLCGGGRFTHVWLVFCLCWRLKHFLIVWPVSGNRGEMERLERFSLPWVCQTEISLIASQASCPAFRCRSWSIYQPVGTSSRMTWWWFKNHQWVNR